MPNYYTKFSTLLPLRSAEAGILALELLEAMRAEGADGAFESDSVGFEAEANEPSDSELQHLWIHHDEHGSIEDVLTFVYACCEKHPAGSLESDLDW